MAAACSCWLARWLWWVVARGRGRAALPTGRARSGQVVTCTYTSGTNPFVVPVGTRHRNGFAYGIHKLARGDSVTIHVRTTTLATHVHYH